MGSHTIGIVKLTVDLSYPMLNCELDLVVPHHIPEFGGDSYKLEQFSLSLAKPSVEIKVDVKVFSGSITVSLDTRTCQITVSGTVKADILVKKFHWSVGPESVSYMTPLRLVEPAWSVNPVTVDAKALQASISAVPADKAIHGKGRETQNDSATQDALRALFTFCGAETFIDDMLDAARTIGHSLPSARPAGAMEATLDASASNVVMGYSIGGLAGALAGGSASGGFFFTTDGNWGIFGSASVGIGLVAELGGGNSVFVYWPDAGNNGLDNFKGANVSAAVDGGEGLTLGVGLSWPSKSFGGDPSSLEPCGVTISLGAGVGMPVNFLVTNSQTWVVMNPPLHFPPPHGH